MTLDSSSSSVATYDSSGNLLSSSNLTPPDPFATPDTLLGSFSCVIDTQKNVTISSHKPFYTDAGNSQAALQFYNEAYTIANARYVVGEGETMQDMVCTTGGGEPKNGSRMAFVGEAIYLKTTTDRRLGNPKGGTDKTYSGGGESISLGYTLPVGKGGSINGSVTFDLNKGSDGWDIANDGKFPGFPDGQYSGNRSNVFWQSSCCYDWQGTTSYKGNTMETLFEWPMSLSTHPKIGTYPTLEYF